MKYSSPTGALKFYYVSVNKMTVLDPSSLENNARNLLTYPVTALYVFQMLFLFFTVGLGFKVRSLEKGAVVV